MLKIYHNPRCSKSRAALVYLEEKEFKFTVREYLKDELDKNELKEILSKLAYKPSDLVRTGESYYKDNDLQNASEEELIQAMISFPKLIERPIITAANGAVIARPLTKLVNFLDEIND